MACTQTLNGIVRDCGANAGGLKAIYIANKDDVTAITLATGGDLISAITMASSAKFKPFYFKPGQASFTQEPQFNDAGDYVGENGVIDVNFGKMNTTKRAQMAALSIGELIVIATDNNGISWLFGYDNPVLRTGGTAESGAAKTDRNNYGLQLTSTDNQLAYEVPAAILEGIV